MLDNQRLGAVRKMPNSEPTKKAIIQALIDSAMVT
ncbi:Uncharacterised protein [Raoultella ornithinolytica]|nr:Uncharacterised protein [Raoultella ornithinolytica]